MVWRVRLRSPTSCRAPTAATVVALVGVGDDPSDPSAPISVVVAATAPGPPTAVSATRVGQTDDVQLSWTAPANNGGSAITQYQVRRDTGAWVDAGAASPFTVAGLADGQPHTYQVRAVNAVNPGPPSTASAPVTIPIPATAPGAPTAVAAARVGQTDNVQVTWTAPVDNGGTAITQYQVRRDTGAWVDAGTASPFTVAGLADGQRHTYQVRAVNTVAPGPASAASAPVTIPVPPVAPGAVTNLGISNTGSTITVSWGAASGTVTNYKVELTGAGAPAVSNVTTLNTTFPNRVAGSYTVTVTAENGALDGPPISGPYTLTLQASSPRNVAAVVNGQNTEVVVTWDPPANPGGDIANYIVSLSPDNADAQTVGADNRTASFSGLPGGNYTVSVVAVNAGGNSPAGTDTFTVVVAPGAPRNVDTTAASGVRTATVTWEAPANNGNGTISAYKITMGGQTKSVAAAAREVTFTNLPIGELTAVVVAVNAQGDSAPGSSPVFRSERPVHPFETEPAFATQVYRDLFDTNPTSAEVGSVTASLTANGSNGPTIITNLMRSARFENRRQVSRLYFAYFLRVPDAAGQEYWGSKMDSGELDLQGVSDLFALSPEFQNTYGGLDEQQFLVVVYNNVFGRAADVGWLQLFVSRAQQGTVARWGHDMVHRG